MKRILFSLAALTACGADAVEAPFVDTREPCAAVNPQRNVYFGDLHVHTALSADAYISSVRVTPEDAYRFARGETVYLPPLADGMGTRPVAIDRPLDFAAVTDHAEFLGEISACTDPDSPAYDSTLCTGARAGEESAFVRFGNALTKLPPSRFSEICADDVDDCLARAGDVWSRVQDAAEQFYDRSASCEFTTFVAYEWSGSTNLSNLHRNVIFRSRRVPATVTSYMDEATPAGLWAALERECTDAFEDCDVMAIPHNSNWSNGNLFHVEKTGDLAGQREAATRRAQMEPLVEIMQHKGDSECVNSISGILGATDEQCAFEKLRQEPWEDCLEGTGDRGMLNLGCLSRLDFVRGVLLEGLKEGVRLGINPYRLGIIASTDTHNGTPGNVSEQDYPGHFGQREDTPEERLLVTTAPDGIKNSPGGLMGVWAEENSRDAIFDAMERREVYGTSGPRIAVRFFGGYDLPLDLCERADLVEQGYAKGVAMGGVLPPPPDGAAAPRFVALALADAGTAKRPGNRLERLQLVKGFVRPDGEAEIVVTDLAGTDDTQEPDPLTCAPVTAGQTQLCASFEDPDASAEQPAFWYVRVLEEPSCRWSTWECLRLEPPNSHPACSDPSVTKMVQERAWTSPIFSSATSDSL